MNFKTRARAEVSYHMKAMPAAIAPRRPISGIALNGFRTGSPATTTAIGDVNTGRMVAEGGPVVFEGGLEGVC